MIQTPITDLRAFAVPLTDSNAVEDGYQLTRANIRDMDLNATLSSH